MSTEQSRQQGKKTPSTRTSEDNKTVAKRAWRQSVLLLTVVFAAVPVLGVVVELYFHKRTVEPTLPRQTLSISNVIEPVRDAIESFTGEQQTSDPKEIDDEQENTRAHLQRLTTLMELADARKLTRHNSQARVNWDMLWAQTATNHDGQRIASNDNTLRQFLALKQIADGRPPRDWTKEFSLIERQVAEATTQPEMNRLADLARRLAQELLESEANYRSYHQWLERLIQQTSSNEILQENLFDVSAAQSQKLAEQIQSCATEASQKTHVEIDTELSELHRKQSSLLSVIQSLEAQLNAVAKGDVADTAEPRSTPIRMASMTAYRQTLPKINSLLKPFISPGYAQPKSRDEFAYEHVKRPMSYSALVDAGAIEDSAQGRETLLRIGGLKSVGQHNDRPLGNFPRMNSTSELDKPDVANRVRDAQRLLKQYAANLIDGGLLAK